MKWHQITLDEVIKIIIGFFVSIFMVAFDYVALYYSWIGHTVKTDFYLTVVLAVVLTVLLLSTFWLFILSWIKKEGFVKTNPPPAFP